MKKWVDECFSFVGNFYRTLLQVYISNGDYRRCAFWAKFSTKRSRDTKVFKKIREEFMPENLKPDGIGRAVYH